MVRLGRTRPLTTDDAPAIPAAIHPRNASRAYDTLSTEHFTRFILNVFFAAGSTSRRVLILTFFRVGVGLCVPILLKVFLEGMPSAITSVEFPIGLLSLAVLLGIAGMVQAVIMQHWYFCALSTFAIITNGINSRIVRHALRLRRSARSTMQTGDLVNHLSSDTEALGEAGFFVPEFFNSALEIVAVLIVLFVFLGPAALAALGALLLMIPLTIGVARRYRRLDIQIMATRDERVTLMSQILHGIRVVKYYAWEGSVGKEVRDVRASEIRTRVRIVQTDAMSTVIFISTTTVVAFVGFGAYVLNGNTLTAPLVFACLALFVMLEEPFGLISHLLANLQHARVATTRLHGFFTAPVRSDHREEEPLSAPYQPVGVSARDLTLKYADATQAAVDGITLDVKAGSAVAIVGAVGSGKSTLLRTLIGIQVPTSGSVLYDGIATGERPRAAYVPQEAFIMNASMYDNVVFGDDDREASAEALDAVLDTCALRPDLTAMPQGLATEIGERGVNLSGGQKQRVALARAAWHRPGIVYLDDPLSAVDVHTEDLLVNDLLFGAWSDITRVVVTHRLAHLSRFDHIVFVEHGRVLAQGTFAELLTSNARFAEYVSETQKPHTETQVQHAPAAHNEESTRAGFMDDEDRETGAVSGKVFLSYVRAMIGHHPIMAPLILLALLVTVVGITALPIMQTSWLSWWTDGAQAGKGLWGSIFTADAFPSVTSPLFAVAVYGLLAIVVLLAWLTERLVWLYRSAYAGARIHNAALAGVLAAPLLFFDRTPMGRILNRFARDQEAVDDHLTWNFEQSFKALSQTIGSMVLILAVMPFIALVIIPVLLVYYRLQRDYRASAREAKRMESIARSPRYAQFKELVTGLDVIHGFARERFFIDTFYDILAKYQRAFWCSILLNRWFSIRVPIISGFVALATCIGIVLLARGGTITPGTAGLVLTYALGFWLNLNWAVRAFSEVESRMTAVERLEHYANLKPEPVTTTTSIETEATLAGRPLSIEVQNLSVRYADDLPLVLRDVSFKVPACAKVGIVGRTGSGKSTLFQALFRFVEPASGRILIDGIDVASIPLPTLRGAIAIIPQDPTLFIGSIRTNLDRFNECTDDDIWNALRRVRMDDLVKGLAKGLDAPVVENGANFSQGQRQLLCMARAILTRASIIVLDEATASVDVETDVLIQRTIREEFKNVTVLIIAHRLNTVADADMIIELSHGRVVGCSS